MTQLDFIGGSPPKAFKDIRNTRPSAAEEKAQLALLLNRLLGKVPASVQNGSVNTVHRWRETRDECQKICANSHSSVVALEGAIKRMSAFR